MTFPAIADQKPDTVNFSPHRHRERSVTIVRSRDLRSRTWIVARPSHYPFP